MTTIRRGYVEVAHGQVHFRCAGLVGAPVLVLLHQTPSTSAMFEPLMRALAPQFRVYALDTPGFGLSDPLPGRFSIAQAAAVLRDALLSLGQRRLFWFGHHTGAALALQAAADFPAMVARLALSGPCLLDQNLRESLPQLAAPLPVREDGSHLTALWDRIRAKDAGAPLSLITREVLAGAAAGDAYPDAYRAVVALDTPPQLRALRCPTLVFAGTHDPLYPQLDAAYRLLRDGRRAEIAGARTFVCERQCQEVAALLRDFFS